MSSCFALPVNGGFVTHCVTVCIDKDNMVKARIEVCMEYAIGDNMKVIHLRVVGIFHYNLIFTLAFVLYRCAVL